MENDNNSAQTKSKFDLWVEQFDPLLEQIKNPNLIRVIKMIIAWAADLRPNVVDYLVYYPEILVGRLNSFIRRPVIISFVHTDLSLLQDLQKRLWNSGQGHVHFNDNNGNFDLKISVCNDKDEKIDIEKCVKVLERNQILVLVCTIQTAEKTMNNIKRVTGVDHSNLIYVWDQHPQGDKFENFLYSIFNTGSMRKRLG